MTEAVSARHPALAARSSRRAFWALIVFRSALFVATLFCLDAAFDLGTSPVMLGLASTLGVVVSSRLAFTRLRTLAAAVILGGGAAGLGLACNLAFYIPTPDKNVFALYNLYEHGVLVVAALSAAAATTWLFWRFRHFATLEILTIALSSIALLAGHRDFRLDHPKVLNSLSWSFGVTPLAMVIILGAGLTGLSLFYLFMSTMPSRPVARFDAPPPSRGFGRANWALGSVVILLLIGAIFGVSKALYDRFFAVSLTRLANGVGGTAEEGLSPLGFHNALGSTNQPAALVRLEGDYSTNPYSPMLYLREMALSRYNGHEMVMAERTFDRDTSLTNPAQPFHTEEDLPIEGRVQVVQSIYLLANHEHAFSIDYPIDIVTLKNPNPGRFRGSYRAYSLAPTYKVEDLRYSEVGDPNWTETQRKHYLEPSTDSRYQFLALEITKDAASPIEKAATIVDYLSRTSIYTLTPNHNTAPDEDQTAPFLFGDHRGYCVHFAHATVYMLRALGIPARIGTGYMTDLSQAKDGHVLLRMSDRHAWAEVYVNRIGWVPFDTQPQQVESHADTQVDMKVLEELMAMLGPDEELLPKELTKDEPNVEEPVTFPVPTFGQLVGFGIGVLGLLVLMKLFLLFGWMLPGSAAARLRRLYCSSSTMLQDMGVDRREGETLSEFRIRVERELGVDPLNATPLLLKASYATGFREGEVSIPAIRAADRTAFRKLPFVRRLLAVFNLRGALGFIMRDAW